MKKERDREDCGILEKEEEGQRKRCIKKIRERGKGKIEVERDRERKREREEKKGQRQRPWLTFTAQNQQF